MYVRARSLFQYRQGKLCSSMRVVVVGAEVEHPQDSIEGEGARNGGGACVSNLVALKV